MPEPKAVQKKQLMNCLRAHGWTFKRQGKRRDIWKKKGDTSRVPVPRDAFIDTRLAIIVLQQAELSSDEIEKFLRSVDLV